jgi:hypothetical protein
VLLGAADRECGYAWGEAAARRLSAEALLLEAAQRLGRDRLAGHEPVDPETQDLIRQAEAEMAAACALQERLHDPSLGQTRARLSSLKDGHLTVYPVHPADRDAGPGATPEAPGAGGRGPSPRGERLRQTYDIEVETFTALVRLKELKEYGKVFSRARWRPQEYGELAKYVDRNATAIQIVLDKAAVALGTAPGGAYVASKINAPRDIASAVYETIRGHLKLEYDFEPPTPGEDQQVIRLAHEVYVREKATCIEIALFYAAALEAAGAAPAVIVLKRRAGFHAVGGFFEVGSERSIEHVVQDPAAIRGLVGTDKLRVVETTGLCAMKGTKKPFHQACGEAEGTIQTDTPIALVNILAARNSGIHPLEFS